MSKKGINIFLIALAIIILAVVVGDIAISFIEKKPENPYEFQTDDYRDVEPELIKYKETKQIKVKAEKPKGIEWSNNKIYLIADKFLQVIEETGMQVLKTKLPDDPFCITVSPQSEILIGFKNYFSIFSGQGEILKTSSVDDLRSIFTSIAIFDSLIYIADAGRRRVLYFDLNAQLNGEFRGDSGLRAYHGFVIPSPFFDLDFNEKGELWVVNSGMHTLQHYSPNGTLLNSWKKASIKIDGFSGCCNPAHYAFSPNGNFITGEKGMVRIKEYNSAGELVAVVAAPEKFKEHGKATDLTVDDEGNVIALDFDKKQIRVFEKK